MLSLYSIFQCNIFVDLSKNSISVNLKICYTENLEIISASYWNSSNDLYTVYVF